jgi:excisionase family DNA binding protein
MMHALHSEWIDAAKFEVLYSLSRRTFWLWIAEGKLIAYRPCKRKTLVKRSDVEKILEASRAAVDLDKIVNETVAEVLGK